MGIQPSNAGWLEMAPIPSQNDKSMDRRSSGDHQVDTLNDIWTRPLGDFRHLERNLGRNRHQSLGPIFD